MTLNDREFLSTWNIARPLCNSWASCIHSRGTKSLMALVASQAWTYGQPSVEIQLYVQDLKSSEDGYSGVYEVRSRTAHIGSESSGTHSRPARTRDVQGLRAGRIDAWSTQLVAGHQPLMVDIDLENRRQRRRLPSRQARNLKETTTCTRMDEQAIITSSFSVISLVVAAHWRIEGRAWLAGPCHLTRKKLFTAGLDFGLIGS